MFPYPSGNGLHIGHFYNYAIIDSYCRYKRYLGHGVFQPFGYDAFGLPAENYARKMGRNPADVTSENIHNFRKQMEHMNTEYEELLTTCSDKYIRETQELFNIMLKRGLAYKKMSGVDYCNSCETTLAREQVVNGNCERCGNPVVEKELDQWFFKITEYKDRLLANLEILDYPLKTINAQRKWLENQHDWCISRQRSWGCPIPIKGEADTLDTFVDSSFYYIVYQTIKGHKPNPVDLYVGGSEHACMHLIYARFVCMVLYDEGLIDFEEPFNKVIHQGIITKDGRKMSKSTGNVVDPSEYDSDELRFYLMFLGHYFDGGDFDDSKIKGIRRFIKRWESWEQGMDEVEIESFIDKVFDYTEKFKFNKVVSEFMTFYNKNKNLNLRPNIKNKLDEILGLYMPGLKYKN